MKADGGETTRRHEHHGGSANNLDQISHLGGLTLHHTQRDLSRRSDGTTTFRIKMSSSTEIFKKILKFRAWQHSGSCRVLKLKPTQSHTYGDQHLGAGVPRKGKSGSTKPVPGAAALRLPTIPHSYAAVLCHEHTTKVFSIQRTTPELQDSTNAQDHEGHPQTSSARNGGFSACFDQFYFPKYIIERAGHTQY